MSITASKRRKSAPTLSSSVAYCSNHRKGCVRAVQVQQQLGGSNCGLFAIANATEFCFRFQTSHAIYKQLSTRKHLMNCFWVQKLLSFPKQKTVEAKHVIFATTDVKVYCVCRLPEDKRQKMAKCPVCSEWFHEKCLDIPGDVFCRKAVMYDQNAPIRKLLNFYVIGRSTVVVVNLGSCCYNITTQFYQDCSLCHGAIYSLANNLCLTNDSD